jgi:hypothetical protein
MVLLSLDTSKTGAIGPDGCTEGSSMDFRPISDPIGCQSGWKFFSKHRDCRGGVSRVSTHGTPHPSLTNQSRRVFVTMVNGLFRKVLDDDTIVKGSHLD